MRAVRYSCRDMSDRTGATALRRGTVWTAAAAFWLFVALLADVQVWWLSQTPGRQIDVTGALIWQSAYAEFYTCDALWPDFGPDAFDAALLEFASRHRRFGR